jgi:hypothetical protein
MFKPHHQQKYASLKERVCGNVWAVPYLLLPVHAEQGRVHCPGKVDSSQLLSNVTYVFFKKLHIYFFTCSLTNRSHRDCVTEHRQIECRLSERRITKRRKTKRRITSRVAEGRKLTGRQNWRDSKTTKTANITKRRITKRQRLGLVDRPNIPVT